MKFPVNWIREYVKTKLTDDELSDLLTSIGFPVDSVEEIGGEKVFEIDITTNRPDCMNIIGLARELAAATGEKLNAPKIHFSEEKTPSTDLGSVDILNPDLCCRYTGKVIRGVKIAPSPDWLARRIIQIGLRPVNNVVDASNYILFELGHPIHIFDLSKLKGHKIVVRTARRGERIVCIDGADRPLSEEMLVIADEQDPVAIAGIMGGSLSEVSDDTTDIFIESAYFNPTSVRLTSKKLGLVTDASFRFERGADFHVTTKAIDLVTTIIVGCAGGKVASGYLDVIKKKPKQKQIRVRMSRIDLLLGLKISQTKAVKILRSLEMGINPRGKGTLNVTLPSFRVDINREADIAEEIARFVRYDTLPNTIPYSTDQKTKSRPDGREEIVKLLLSGAGYSEAINYSMISDEEDSYLVFHKESKPIRISNPISEKLITLRRSLLPGLFRNVAGNFSRGMKDVRLFEIGKVYQVSTRTPSDEKKNIGIIATGTADAEHWSQGKRNYDIWDIKGAVEAILKKLDCTWSLRGLVEEPFFEKGSSFEFVSPAEKRIAIGGKVRATLAHEHKVPQAVWAAEISLDDLPVLQRKIRFKPVSPLPIIRRDISIIVDGRIRYAEIERLLREKWKDSSVNVKLGNRYSGAPIPEGKISLMLSLTIHQKEKTLTNEEINKIMEDIFSILAEGAGAELRKE